MKMIRRYTLYSHVGNVGMFCLWKGESVVHTVHDCQVGLNFNFNLKGF